MNQPAPPAAVHASVSGVLLSASISGPRGSAVVRYQVRIDVLVFKDFILGGHPLACCLLYTMAT